MTTARGEISSGRPSELNKQLTGKVWLCQNRSEWPIVLQTSESQVLTWLANNPDGAAWEYEIKPVVRVRMIRPEPTLEAVPYPETDKEPA